MLKIALIALASSKITCNVLTPTLGVNPTWTVMSHDTFTTASWMLNTSLLHFCRWSKSFHVACQFSWSSSHVFCNAIYAFEFEGLRIPGKRMPTVCMRVHSMFRKNLWKTQQHLVHELKVLCICDRMSKTAIIALAWWKIICKRLTPTLGVNPTWNVMSNDTYTSASWILSTSLVHFLCN